MNSMFGSLFMTKDMDTAILKLHLFIRHFFFFTKSTNKHLSPSSSAKSHTPSCQPTAQDLVDFSVNSTSTMTPLY